MTHLPLATSLAERFGAPVEVPPELEENPALAAMSARGSCRHFRPEPVAPATLGALCAVALAAPTKSDLQQRDIVIVQEAGQLAALKALLAGQGWIAGAPTLLVFCANNRRQRLLHRWWNRAFANDHLDAFFNAAVDAGIALAAFVTAAEAAGFGCCPISTIRNRAQEVSDLLGLPQHVFPVAGLAVGRPEHAAPRISRRLPLAVTVHRDRYAENDLREQIETYDTARAAHRPIRTQRDPDRFGIANLYTWSDDKTRQYAAPERAGFGAFIRARGFDLR